MRATICSQLCPITKNSAVCHHCGLQDENLEEEGDAISVHTNTNAKTKTKTNLSANRNANRTLYLRHCEGQGDWVGRCGDVRPSQVP